MITRILNSRRVRIAALFNGAALLLIVPAVIADPLLFAAPEDPPGLREALETFLMLDVVTMFIPALVNIGKRLRIVPDGYANIVTYGLTLGLFVVYGAAELFSVNLGFGSGLFAQFANLLTALAGLITQFVVAGGTFKSLDAFSVPVFGYSRGVRPGHTRGAKFT